jgi:hypothetical protein
MGQTPKPIDDGGPAFPGGAFGSAATGMSLRAWLMGQALQGLACGCAAVLNSELSAYGRGPCDAGLVDRALVLADRAIAELNKGRTDDGDAAGA